MQLRRSQLTQKCCLIVKIWQKYNKNNRFSSYKKVIKWFLTSLSRYIGIYIFLNLANFWYLFCTRSFYIFGTFIIPFRYLFSKNCILAQKKQLFEKNVRKRLIFLNLKRQNFQKILNLYLSFSFNDVRYLKSFIHNKNFKLKSRLYNVNFWYWQKSWSR